MRKAADLVGIAERSTLAVRRGIILGVFEELPYRPEFEGLLGLEEVMRFWRTARKRFEEEPEAEAEFKLACRQRWPEMLAPMQELIALPGREVRAVEQGGESLVASRARFVLKLG